MKIIIPMAGMGKRMRPHTLTIPKPLISIAGKPIVERLVEDIAKVCNEKIEEIGFIINPEFGPEVEKSLIAIAEKLGTKGIIYYQEKALGTAHAVLCAQKSLSGNVIVAFADTLFIANFTLLSNQDSTIWVQKVDDPSAFGVVKLDNQGYISDFIEKPKDFVSDLAIIGIYYFKDGDNLKKELQYLIDNNVVVKGEYQLTDALENMKNKGIRFSVGQVDEWLDCGNKQATVQTNKRVLNKIGNQVSQSANLINSVVIQPCFIGDNVKIENSVVGPFSTISNGCSIKNSVITECLVQQNSTISNVSTKNSMIGNECVVSVEQSDYNLGDFSCIDK